jgi:hypothetical protein
MQQVSDALFSLLKVPKRTGRFLMRWLASLICCCLLQKKHPSCEIGWYGWRKNGEWVDIYVCVNSKVLNGAL